MNLIRQSYEFINQKGFTLEDIVKHIERCARVSYKSEDKITNDSCHEFVYKLVKNEHYRPLEFGTVHLKMDSTRFSLLQEYLIEENMYNSIWLKWVNDSGDVYITTNYRYYLDIIRKVSWVEEFLFESDDALFFTRYTIHMILNRGIMDEFRTHVTLSHLAESTRFCNYSKNKFNNELTFIIPNWCNYLVEGPNQECFLFETNDNEARFINALQCAQDYYFSLLKTGWKPQQARDILPLATKSELISCGFKDAWDNFLEKRCAKDAHPMAQEIALKIKNDFNGILSK